MSSFVMYFDMSSVLLHTNCLFIDNRFEERQKPRVGTKRRIRLDLDPRQYFEDNASGNNCYETFNLLIRRNGRENTFKSVLNTIRSLGKKKDLSRFLPTFMHDVLLGTNNPLSASYFW